MPSPPESFVSPVAWGKEEIVRERFTAAGIAENQISCEKATYTFRYNRGPQDFLKIFRDYYGPTMNAFEAAEKAGCRTQLQAELEQLFLSENHATDGATEIPASYLRVLITK